MAACRGRTPLDIVWRNEVLAEASAGEGMEAASFTYDIAKFYDHVSLELLAVMCRLLQYPLGPLRGAFRAYRLPCWEQLRLQFTRAGP